MRASTPNSRRSAVDEDLEVELAHPGDHGLAGVDVGADAERRILDRRARSSAWPSRAWSVVGRGLDDDADHRLGDVHRGRARSGRRGSHSVSPVVAVRPPTIAPIIAGLDLADVLAVVRVHPDQPADLLDLALGRVEHRRRRLRSVPA